MKIIRMLTLLAFFSCSLQGCFKNKGVEYIETALVLENSLCNSTCTVKVGNGLNTEHWRGWDPVYEGQTVKRSCVVRADRVQCLMYYF